ncbi:sulfur carrier protein ThiS [Gordonia sp. (in: high G+C Gram-positive bacteria)]|jgi:sulfur carrier protein|uniref:sulfur carrier protein ThiS n=1 Tax=Gordonia sp. (in: high G+C Gram-positive bacteria) TaxID=84139 RepID=UPI001D21A863|nr:sulfur carrier protein ThiS [Gordonia sp. (in: high G+C Gram-positive bacteria)]MCB1295927.1 sulfur carrier protein ThiS [Gordonia sp. (in: high G+C Gram-positive bacteria)]HMS76155.1 sulfur carrier protein ThiS [Gordonia sp. (in: high G+C Gram-positive bacteria)]HQV20079.1 sulfur carrier protein ThiS [Gordonia sp. (in: high G+C Gram-positive bacteria)]
MVITVNGDRAVLPDRCCVTDMLGALGFPERGIAVAVDGEVVSRRDWSSPLIDGAEVEVLTAVQGG